MNTKTFAAQYVFTNEGLPIKNGAVTINETTGEILEIKPLTKEIFSTEFHNGIIVPGFVNTHCHLELCHLKDKVQNANSLLDFLVQMFKLSQNVYDESLTKSWDNFMYETGVSVVGDISNTPDTANVKKNSKIRYINFVELLGSTTERCQKDKIQYQNVREKFLTANQNPDEIIACPHAPYSVSPELFYTINLLNGENKKMISIHNQESFDENLLYKNHSGGFVERFPMNLTSIPATGKTSLQSVNLQDYQRVIFVHNIYSSDEDLDFAKSFYKEPYFVICPKSNIILEKKMLEVNKLISRDLPICIGTDSLSSNDSLSMIDELKVFSKSFPHLPITEIIKFATLNGAKALGVSSEFGTLSKGKTPGIVLIENVDFQEFKLTKESRARRLK
ncbi:MAG: amidohydrolase family protein [Bacteroidales bacterium]|nr:amidohydrolase family protein [Bacteroidales bacterium]